MISAPPHELSRSLRWYGERPHIGLQEGRLVLSWMPVRALQVQLGTDLVDDAVWHGRTWQPVGGEMRF
jgi:hypothetical protein